jgi:hypothetical protein
MHFDKHFTKKEGQIIYFVLAGNCAKKERSDPAGGRMTGARARREAASSRQRE